MTSLPYVCVRVLFCQGLLLLLQAELIERSSEAGST